ncbi:MAG: MBL fold metallo-hydrolase [Anaerolineae bacterium]|nr:MBL fold metallo-hydrolase [Anaerolineae bacterium]
MWSLGQSGLVLKGGPTVVYIDPYLSNRIADDWGGPARQFPPPVEPHQVTNAQVVFCTHEHADHTDPWTLGAAGPGVAPGCLCRPRQQPRYPARGGCFQRAAHRAGCGRGAAGG